MTVYKVVVQREALLRAQLAADYIAIDSPQNGLDWLLGFYSVIDRLEQLPHRTGIARERERNGRQLRHYIHHSHRIIYEVDEAARIVNILTVIHSAQDRWQP